MIRETPLRREYVRKTAELIDAFYQVFEQMLDDGFAQFAYDRDFRRPFSAAEYMGFSGSRKLISGLIDRAKRSVRNHWMQFYITAGEQVMTEEEKSHSQACVSAYRFGESLPQQYCEGAKSEHVRDIIIRLQEIGPQASKIDSSNNYTVRMAILKGVNTAANSAIGCAVMAKMWDKDPTLMALISSKVDSLQGDFEDDVFRYDGGRYRSRAGCPHAESGISQQWLDNHGYGTTLGCPAGIGIFGRNTVRSYAARAQVAVSEIEAQVKQLPPSYIARLDVADCLVFGIEREGIPHSAHKT
ncbi:MAG: hypothetical protein OXR66_02415 [Candidatus Woesearchaeota archaeon]|nr:hypothetical protein [Candidatus Woesearchaeota archaeon]